MQLNQMERAKVDPINHLMFKNNQFKRKRKINLKPIKIKKNQVLQNRNNLYKIKKSKFFVNSKQ